MENAMSWKHGAALAAALALAGCGGGGGGAGGDGTSQPAAAPRSTALTETSASAAFDFAGFAALRPLRSIDLVADASRFADPARTYVSIFATGADGQLQQLAFLRLSTLQALDGRGGLSLDLPRDLRSVQFEVYDRGGESTRLTGELAR
jgi:hypothetical protein